jgi:hypothetical protein
MRARISLLDESMSTREGASPLMALLPKEALVGLREPKQVPKRSTAMITFASEILPLVISLAPLIDEGIMSAHDICWL